MELPDPCDQWRIDVNDRYQRVVDLFIGLSTGALILPALFLKEYLGVPETYPLLMYLEPSAYSSVAAFFLAISLGVVYHYTSAKWVKCAWHQPTYFRSRTLERLLDWSFWLMVLSFMTGLGLFLLFVAHA